MTMTRLPPLPTWASELITAYESGAASQFILAGNVNDRLLLPLPTSGTGEGEWGTIVDFLNKVMLPRFDVVLVYDLGSGLRVERGGQIFSRWPRMKETPSLPRTPREAVDVLGHYLRYCANLSRLGQERIQVGVIVRSADLVAPNQPGGGFEPNSIACQLRDWAGDSAYADQPLATFLIADNIADLHPLVAGNPRACTVRVPLPSAEELSRALAAALPRYPTALAEFKSDTVKPAGLLAGATFSAVESLLKTREHLKQALLESDLLTLKKTLVERDCGGLIEFIAAKRTLDDYAAGEALKKQLRQDLALWKAGDLQALPMGYLLCGPVGTGKTYLVECLAGEAGVPVVKLKNFRDKWVGSTEGNLEKIFRLIQALGRAIVFIDEADQALGRRNAGGDDSGIGGRVYAMMAQEMSNTANRGKVMWVLASSRPDLIEVDLKRPGRIDVKIPIFPTATPDESWTLIRALAKRRSLELPAAIPADLGATVPTWLTPGAAEALATKVYRTVKTQNLAPLAALADSLTDWQPPVPRAILEAQIRLAVAEATDLDFVPEAFRSYLP
jgi:hypothetical protein